MSIHNQRVEYGRTLVELGKEMDNIVVLEADLGKSTMSSMFEAEFPERYFEMGIAEQNMTSFAGGLSLTGKIPFTNTFAVFAAGRAYDQIRQSIGTANLNVKIVGSSSGLSDFGDGATHQAIDDLAIMSAIPNMTVLTPCDGIETRMALRAAVEINGPVYIRLCRNDLNDIFPEDIEYKIGEPVVLLEGKDITVYTNGIMAHEALKAAELLRKEDIELQVVHVNSMKPVNEEAIRKYAQSKKGIIVCEEHSIRGGLNMLISYILRDLAMPFESVAVFDKFGQSGESHELLLEKYELNAKSIIAHAHKIMRNT